MEPREEAQGRRRPPDHAHMRLQGVQRALAGCHLRPRQARRREAHPPLRQAPARDPRKAAGRGGARRRVRQGRHL